MLQTHSARYPGEPLQILEVGGGNGTCAAGVLNYLRREAPATYASSKYMLVEVSGSDASHDEAKLSAFVDEAMESGDVVDGTIAQDGAQSAALWRLREGITEALGRTGRVYKYDVSLPLAQLYDLVEETRARMAPHGALVSGFGHLGDGNLHLNVCTPGAFDADAAVAAAIEPWVFEYIAERRGSISAEHGVGVMKPHVLHLSKRPPVIGVMHALKRLLDPRGILNPGKVLPPPLTPDPDSSSRSSGPWAPTIRLWYSVCLAHLAEYSRVSSSSDGSSDADQ